MRMIVCIVERGKADAVVKKAVEGGATGATIFYGRGSGEAVFSFFKSLGVESSKEVIMILVRNDACRGIMDIAAEAAHVEQKGKGIVFSVPVDDVRGIESDVCT